MNSFFYFQEIINNGLSPKPQLNALKEIPLLLRIMLRGNNEQYFAQSPNGGYQEIMFKYVNVKAKKRLMRRNKNYKGFVTWHNANAAIYNPYLFPVKR